MRVSPYVEQRWRSTLTTLGPACIVGLGLPGIPAKRFCSGKSCRRGRFFLEIFAGLVKVSPQFAVFDRFTIDLYIKIVVIVNAGFSVDKSLFFNRIKRLREK